MKSPISHFTSNCYFVILSLNQLYFIPKLFEHFALISECLKLVAAVLSVIIRVFLYDGQFHLAYSWFPLLRRNYKKFRRILFLYSSNSRLDNKSFFFHIYSYFIMFFKAFVKCFRSCKLLYFKPKSLEHSINIILLERCSYNPLEDFIW